MSGCVLGDDEVHVWLAFDEGIHDADLLARYAAMLDPAERELAARMHFAHDRHQRIVARALQREVLSRYEPQVAPRDWTFTRNARGRPDIAPVHGTQRLHFNLAHTRGLVAIAVARHAQIGIDTENVVIRRAPLRVANRYFSAAEIAALEALPVERRDLRFYELWTLKEAYLKARGTGLTVHLDRMSFAFDPAPRFELGDGDGDGDTGAGWRFGQFAAGDSHLVALAVRAPARMPVLKVGEVTAAGGYRELPAPDVTAFTPAGFGGSPAADDS